MKAIFIAGPARSGSTLLGRMLARIQGFVCVGELRFIGDRGFAKNTPRGCGKPFRECASSTGYETAARRPSSQPLHHAGQDTRFL